MSCGIYQIKNNISGNRYIGQSSDIVGRRKEHKHKLRHNKHENPHLQKSFHKYGMDAFTFSVLLYCDPYNLSLYEQLCIDHLKPEYNILTECVGTSLGYKHTEEARRKMREAQSRINREGARKGIPPYEMTDEIRQKMSEAQKGRVVSEETRKKMSESRKGVPISDETRKRMSEARKGKAPYKMTEETRQKMSKAKTGRTPYEMTEETKKRMSEAKKGRRPYIATDETRKKMSESAKLRQQRIKEQA